MRLLISFAALFLSVILLQLSSVGPLDVLSGITLGFSNQEIGLLGSAHFVGFFVGCWWAPRVMGSVGHSRAFAAFTAAGSIGLMSHMLVIDPYAWALMRVASGFCVAGCYTVVEAWLNAKVTNETRGRTMGAYLTPASYVSYNLLAILCSAALLPLVLTRLPQPETPAQPRLRPRLAMDRSPLAAAAVVVAALSSASFRMGGPIYGQEVGLSAGQIAWFLSAFVLGGALAQFPIGWLADKFDRRWGLIWLSAASIVSCAVTVMAAGMGTGAVFLSATLFGLTTFPIYSVAASHAHDFAKSEERVELSAALMFWFAVGAIFAPYLASVLIENYGPAALFGMISIGHGVLVIFGLTRMRARPTAKKRTPYVYAPRTTFTIGRLMRRQRDNRSDGRKAP